MPKSDTWPGGVAMESISNLDSAGSYDSVISMNSGYSEDSMEHLSAEERACLMYLEETIEALEVQEDSGLSNDEPDPGLRQDKMGPMRVNDISSFKSEPGSTVDMDGHHALNVTSEPQSSPLETAMNLMTQPNPPVHESVDDCKIHPSATPLCVSTDEDGHLKIVPSASLCPSPSPGASEIDESLIPPPSDFMDEPSPPPQPAKVKAAPLSAGMLIKKPGGPIDLEQLRQRASVKGTSVSTPVTQEPANQPSELSLPIVSSGPPLSPPPEGAEPRSPPAVAPKPKKLPSNIILKSHKAAVSGSDGNPAHSVHASSDRLLLDPQRVRMEALRKLGLLPAEADSGPALSPKLSPKSRRSWAAPSSPISPAAPQTPPLTPSYTRVNSSPPVSVPLQSPPAVSLSAPAVQPVEVLPAPPAEVLPTAPVEVLPAPPAEVLPTAPVEVLPAPPAEVLPAPPAFSDPVEPPLSDDEQSAAGDELINTPPLTPPVLFNHLTPPKVTGVKSATLERSGLGLSSYMANQDYSASSEKSPSQIRNSRTRPASLGSGKEFSSAHGGGLHVSPAISKEPDLRRSLPAFQHSSDSQKLPRSQGISVLISPRSENGEDRREALKKLGLLRD